MLTVYIYIIYVLSGRRRSQNRVKKLSQQLSQWLLLCQQLSSYQKMIHSKLIEILRIYFLKLWGKNIEVFFSIWTSIIKDLFYYSIIINDNFYLYFYPYVRKNNIFSKLWIFYFSITLKLVISIIPAENFILIW